MEELPRKTVFSLQHILNRRQSQVLHSKTYVRASRSSKRPGISWRRWHPSVSLKSVLKFFLFIHQNYLHEPKNAMVIIKPNQPDMILTCLEKLKMVPSAFDFVNGAEVERPAISTERHIFNNWNIFKKEIFSKTDENHIPFYTNVLDGSS